MPAPSRTAGTVQVEGLRQLRRTLRQAGEDLSDLKDINRQAAATVAQAAGGRVPTRSGALAASIRGAGTKTAAIVRAGKKAVPYANTIHWGRHYWPRKNHARARPSPIEPRPFLSQAAQATEPRWVQLYTQQLETIISRIEGA